MKIIRKRAGYRSLVISALVLPGLVLLVWEILEIDFYYNNDILLRAIQVLSALAATCSGLMAAVVGTFPSASQRQWRKPYLSWIAGALLAMGIFTGFLTAVPVNDARYSWLGFLLKIFGSLFVLGVWTPARISEQKALKWLIPVGAIFLSVITALVVLHSPTLPTLLVEGHYWDGDYIWIVNVAGLLFLAGAFYFVRLFREYQRTSELLFAHFALLSGISNILWHGLHLWGPVWWIWYLMQLGGYSCALFYMLVLHFSLEGELENSEQRLKIANQELARANFDLEQFANLASHDLQEPLRNITNFLGLLAKRSEEKLDTNSREYLAFAIDGASRMQRLIRNLLAYARIGPNAANYVLTDCKSVIDQVAHNLRPLLSENRAQLTYSSMPTIKTDPIFLEQLFQNLIVNAIKYCEEREPRVEVSAEPTGRNTWLFCVKDNGQGIAPENTQKIFALFARLNDRRISGNGIGLAICKKAVEVMGGRIWVESELGKGSTFFFTVPNSCVP